MEDNFFRKKLLEGLNHERIAYDDSAWHRLASQLDNTTKPQQSRRMLSAWWLLLLLPLLGWNVALQHQVSALQTQIGIEKKEITSQQNVVQTTYIHDTITKVYYRTIYLPSKEENKESQKLAFDKNKVINNSLSDIYDNNNQKQKDINIEKNTEKNIQHKGINTQENTQIIATIPNEKEDKTAPSSEPIKSENTTNTVKEEKALETPQSIIKKKRTIQFKINDLSIGMAKNAFFALSANEMNAAIGLYINPNNTLQLGIGSQQARADIAHEVIEKQFPAPLPHQAMDSFLVANYQAQHLSFPFQIQHFFKIKNNKFSPYIQVGALLQKHQKTNVIYNYQTMLGDTYYINKEYAESHWKTFGVLQFGANIPIFKQFSSEIGVQSRFLLNKNNFLSLEKYQISGTIRLKYSL
ncbi:MAG: hypothetical protein RLZZ292_2300 [Bacteroidota bacterium]|jgi:hypothetical protein